MGRGQRKKIFVLKIRRSSRGGGSIETKSQRKNGGPIIAGEKNQAQRVTLTCARGKDKNGGMFAASIIETKEGSKGTNGD